MRWANQEVVVLCKVRVAIDLDLIGVLEGLFGLRLTRPVFRPVRFPTTEVGRFSCDSQLTSGREAASPKLVSRNLLRLTT